MSPTKLDILVFLLLTALMVGPWTWMNHLSEKQNLYWGGLGFKILPLLAFFLTFGRHSEQWDTQHVMFSNDGGGVDYSRWLREAVPGTPYWQDNYWLGDSGQFPVTISYMLKWLGYHPVSVVILLGFGAMFYGIATHNKRNH